MNRAKRRGTAWESRLVAYFREHGWPACERRALSGAEDRGDIAGLPCVIEAKNHKTLALAEWMDEAKKEQANAGASLGVVCFPRRNHSVDQAYVLLQLSDFLELIR